MIRRLKADIMLHIQKNITLYLIILFAILTGIASGIFTAYSMTIEQKYALSNHLKVFFQYQTYEPISKISIFWKSFKQNFQYSILIWIAGLVIFGAPVIILLIGVRSFFIGFTFGFLLERYNIGGFLFTLLCILPQSIIYMAGFLFLGVIAMEKSLTRFKRRKVTLPKEQVKQETLFYFTKILVILIVLSIGNIMEAYIGPAFFSLFKWVFD